MSLFDLRLSDLHHKMKSGEVKASDLVDQSIQRIDQVEDTIKAFITVDEEGARNKAEQIDQAIANKEEIGLLAGLPIGIKDNINTEGVRTTCASQILHNYYPIYDATAMKHIHTGQAIMIGKCNMDEFAMGGSTENSGFHPTHNPWNIEHVPGGSSGGSAAAVASGEVYFALGSDTGGSIRQPAAYCGIVGLKPTYGRVSRYGLTAFASSLDQIGPLTKNVEDAAYVLQAIAAYDEYDSTSANVEVPDYLSALTQNVQGLKIGVPSQFIGEGIDAQVKERVLDALKQFEKMGATWEEVSLPHVDYAVATYYLLAPAEASSNLANYDGVRFGHRTDQPENLLDMYKKTRSEGFGDEVKRRIMLGTYALSSGYYDAYYLKAQKVRTLMREDFKQVFNNYDVIIGPTTPTPAFKIGEQINDPLTMYLNDICTIPVNLAGLPAISVPCGQVDGLPVGLQIIGQPFDESTVLRVAHAYEQETDHHQHKPKL